MSLAFTSRLARAAWQWSIILLSLGLFMLNGCNRGTSTTTPNGTTTAVPKEVRLGYFANLTHAQAVLGTSSGEFQAAIGSSSTLKPVIFNAGPALIETLLADKLDIGYVGPGPALNAFAKSHGEGIRVISGSAANGVLIVASKESGITKLEDLAGKKVATPQLGNTQDISARHYLLKVLNQKNLDNVLPVANAEQAGMMARQQIDASWAPEPWGSFLVMQAGAQIIGEEKDLWPDKKLATVVVVTTPKFLKDHPDTVKAILSVHQKWTQRLSESPDKYLPDLKEAMFKLTQKSLPPEVVKSAIGYTSFTTDPLPQTFDTYSQWSLDLGFSKQKQSTEGLIDLSVLQQLDKIATNGSSK